MITKRVAAAGTVPVAVLLSVMLAGCGGSAPAPGAAPSSSAASPTATATASPSLSPTPSAKPSASSPAPRTSSPVPSSRVVSSRVAYRWAWPNWYGPARVTHTYSVPPVPQLVRIGVGDHPRDPGERPFDRMSFTFTTAFPSYRFQFAPLVGDPSGKVIPLKGMGSLTIVFSLAQAHTADGSRSSITVRPSHDLRLVRMVDYAQAGDFEGVLTYGIGIAWPIAHSNPQIAVRAYEVETVTASGQHLYTVAFDVDATNPAGY